MQKVINKGFTLIELLVVIAIIGILASIVLVSLGNARSSGADAGIKGNLDSIRTQAEIYAGDNSGSYGTLATTTFTAATSCTGGMWSNTTISNAVANAVTQAGTADFSGATGAKGICGSTSTNGWAIAVVLKATANTLWCVDSSGVAKSVAAGSMPASAANFARCP